jgi:hypothetical protein
MRYVKKEKFKMNTPENSTKSRDTNKVHSLWLLVGLTIAALVPQYLMRGSMKACFFFYEKFTTYFGDLWYCYSHYLTKGHSYPREYISGMQVIYRAIFPHRFLWSSYERYMLVISVFLAIFAILTTYFLYLLITRTHRKTKRMIIFWLFAPSFLFYGLYNFELLTVFTIILAYFLFKEEEYYLAAGVLALGTSLKVFPIFLTPLFFFQSPRQYRIGSVLSFIITWLAFNLPFMLNDWNAWVFPYQWQIEHNISTSPADGTYWWIIYKLVNPIGLTPYIGKISLLLFGGLYYYFIKKYWHLPLARKCAIVIFLFLLTDRIFSPQYILYLLPFLVLVDYDLDMKYFYLAEIPSVLHVFLMFFHRENPAYLQVQIFIKYFALIMLFSQLLKRPVEIDTDKAYASQLAGINKKLVVEGITEPVSPTPET